MEPVGESGTRETGGGVRVPTVALTAGGWAVGLLVMAVTLGTPYLLFGYHSPSLHVVLGTIDACVALLLAYLVFGRYLRSRLLQDLLLGQGLVLLAVAGLGMVFFLHLFDDTDFRPGTFDVWLPQLVRTVGAVLIVASSIAGDRRTAPSTRAGARIFPWALILGGFVVLWVMRDQLPVALGESPPTSAQRPVITGHPLLLVAQGLSAACFVVASIAFTARAASRDDELLRWLGPACAVGAFARLSYVLFPSLYSDWIYTGDVLRTVSYLLLLVGAAREISQYWSAQARAAVLEDRRRLARELHDGVVQELAYIRAEALAEHPTDAGGRILSACDRALDEARAAVDALGRDNGESLAVVLHRATEQVAARYDARLEVELDDSVDADAEQRHALVRIAREAVSNAIRHGGAERVHLRLSRDGDARRLVVHDDGEGFDPVEVTAAAPGFGLTSMRERALALPGSFDLRSAHGEGTKVEVAW